ncbi:MAG: hypothetical protein GW906_05465 [Epsilonproteobacteria bacterium]|nr:hypothetical protein [Campylobacterota bacterium]OIO18030.1 MAG: hypothetical protein AUJ81_00305 [Helicobacteraceae bacterium CG1_02_36_14]PIP09798.1 MAG: hypothetical protein COX50_08785 [Sulfurimonas sp. CG23_combo_of_CG06-09_8_20_14_all_36_33]PIS24012.1 MAG: hypothetical protein COT46_10725 [Sulfurimonas sp. CG08_land_8_20_14_0_20_36_33]PIU35496.1 MAG: hypothetical protein COT05_02865 [Sulfurimonas sp. CG07_land_8_20_14_0_80_36_56]PIV05417.1 MAG: hypothetical protein COS56_01175 [Sulfur
MRLTPDEYAIRFKMSREMVNSKLKAKKLDYTIENGVTYIFVESEILEPNKQEEIAKKKVPATVQNAVARPKTTVATVLGLYQRENQHLKDKILQLEAKVDKLIDDKEQMLRDEIDKIQRVYFSKDEQLKNILELVNTKLMLEQTQTIHDVESFEKSEQPLPMATLGCVELREYLKTLNLRAYQRKVIKKRFLAVYDTDIRIIQRSGKLYLDFSKYDYSDLLTY